MHIRRLKPILLVLALTATPALAQQTPLLMDGKDTLFQRVLVRERSVAHSAPDQAGSRPVRPLEALYVYAREGDWVQVGADDDGGDLFWLPASAVTEWRQNIVATFEGSEAMAISMGYRINANTQFDAGVTYGFSQDQVGARVGVTYAW